MTDGEGTRSYAKALFRFLCWEISQTNSGAQWYKVGMGGNPYLELENILDTFEFLLVSVIIQSYQQSVHRSGRCRVPLGFARLSAGTQ